MKYPECQTDNAETRKFCRECGAKLILICPKCGFENLPEDKFCGECGEDLRLSEGSHDIDFNQPQSYSNTTVLIDPSQDRASWDHI